MVQHERSSTFVMVPCSCGRSLRAKIEQVGTEVRCWDCHKMVLVPDPHEAQRVARELSDSALVVIKGPGLNSVLMGAAVVTGLLAIPGAGVACSGVALLLGASAYGEIIRRISRGPREGLEPGLWSTLLPRSFLKFVLCALMAAGTVAPLWYLNSGTHQSPHFDRVGRSIAAFAWVVIPLLMLVLYGRTDEDTPIGFRGCSRLIAKHPFASLLALSVVPITLFLVEVTLAIILYLTGNLPFFALDFMPMPLLASRNEGPIMFQGIPHYHMIDYRTYPPSMFHEGYLGGLGRGYSLAGALPASLSLPIRNGLDAGKAIGLTGPSYVIIRLLFTIVIVTCLLAAFAIQARWLGSIPALERRKKSISIEPRAESPPTH